MTISKTDLQRAISYLDKAAKLYDELPMQKCEDRAHRIGQKNNVNCYYLIARNTIDPVLYNIIHKKRSIANQIMASDDVIPTDELYFDELVNSFLNHDI